eukprot:67051-Chlamydomonas_euryale.AAC.8
MHVWSHACVKANFLQEPATTCMQGRGMHAGRAFAPPPLRTPHLRLCHAHGVGLGITEVANFEQRQWEPGADLRTCTACTLVDTCMPTVAARPLQLGRWVWNREVWHAHARTGSGTAWAGARNALPPTPPLSPAHMLMHACNPHLQQRVFQFDVPVGDAALVAVVCANDELLEEPPRNRLLQPTLPATGEAWQREGGDDG